MYSGLLIRSRTFIFTSGKKIEGKKKGKGNLQELWASSSELILEGKIRPCRDAESQGRRTRKRVLGEVFEEREEGEKSFRWELESIGGGDLGPLVH